MLAAFPLTILGLQLIQIIAIFIATVESLVAPFSARSTFFLFANFPLNEYSFFVL